MKVTEVRAYKNKNSPSSQKYTVHDTKMRTKALVHFVKDFYNFMNISFVLYNTAECKN